MIFQFFDFSKKVIEKKSDFFFRKFSDFSMTDFWSRFFFFSGVEKKIGVQFRCKKLCSVDLWGFQSVSGTLATSTRSIFEKHFGSFFIYLYKSDEMSSTWQNPVRVYCSQPLQKSMCVRPGRPTVRPWLKSGSDLVTRNFVFELQQPSSVTKSESSVTRSSDQR